MLTKAELQRVRSLREKKHRETLGLFVVEGEKVVRELLAADFPFEQIYLTEACGPWPGSSPAVPRTASPTQARITRVTAEEMTRLSHFPTPSTVLGVGKISRPGLASAALARGLTLALDGVQDAGNVGTILRIADWFGFDRVVLSPDCADLFHQKVINASMGSFARVPTHSAELAPLLAELAATSPATPILGCVLDGEDVHAIGPVRDAIVVIGSEGRGVSSAVTRCLTRRITIPRFGRAESLNAAIAAAIVCDNLRRAR